MTTHKLVPCEPTDEMINATENIEILTGHGDDAVFIDIFEAVKIYKAMLESAPEVSGDAVAYAEQDNVDMKEYDDLLFSYPVSIKPTENRTVPLYTTPQPDRTAQLEAELETERQRLAACGVAALGYFEGCLPQYKSGSLNDVLCLRDSNKQLEAEKARLLDALRASNEMLCAGENAYAQHMINKTLIADMEAKG